MIEGERGVTISVSFVRGGAAKIKDLGRWISTCLIRQVILATGQGAPA
ncbi:MAG: hypothetical protein R3A51_06295 [Nannocystaceae bacterium]